MIRLAVFAIVAAAGAIFVLPKAPHMQHVRFHLGSGSSRIVLATARIGRPTSGSAGKPHGLEPLSAHPPLDSDRWERETIWHFDHGAPPSIEWSFELPNGEADLEVELASAAHVVGRNVKIDLASGGETKVELVDVMGSLE
ncbi:MAG: hypothetical protein NVS3B20_11140 [Polyangiales bacterium]